MKQMRKIKIGTVLFAVFAFSAFVTASAFAVSADEFLISGEPALAGTQLLSQTNSSTDLLLEDMKGGIFGEAVHITCSGENLAEVESAQKILILAIFPLGGTDPMEGATAIKCTTNAGTCGEPEALAVHLPWLDAVEELSVLTEGTQRVTVESGGSGAPGWTVTCNKIVEDECTGESTVLVENVESMVNATFETVSNEKAATCTRGGAKEGLVEGTILFESTTAGLAVAVS